MNFSELNLGFFEALDLVHPLYDYVSISEKERRQTTIN